MVSWKTSDRRAEMFHRPHPAGRAAETTPTPQNGIDRSIEIGCEIGVLVVLEHAVDLLGGRSSHR